MFRATVSLMTVPACVLLLAGCGEEPGGQAPLATETARNGDVFNSADVAFATATIPLHAEALAMVDLTLERELTAEVAAVVDEISLGHAQEVQEMTTWLTAWDEPIPETVRDHVNAGHGDEHEDHVEYPSEELERLGTAGEEEFEEVLLELLVDNHEDTVAAARAAEEDGAFEPATELAATIRAASEERIGRMEELLGE